MLVGVEVGGTFTGLVAIEGGRVRIAKVPSTPARPDEGALAALGRRARRRQRRLADASGPGDNHLTVVMPAQAGIHGNPMASTEPAVAAHGCRPPPA